MFRIVFWTVVFVLVKNVCAGGAARYNSGLAIDNYRGAEYKQGPEKDEYSPRDEAPYYPSSSVHAEEEYSPGSEGPGVEEYESGDDGTGEYEPGVEEGPVEYDSGADEYDDGAGQLSGDYNPLSTGQFSYSGEDEYSPRSVHRPAEYKRRSVRGRVEYSSRSVHRAEYKHRSARGQIRYSPRSVRGQVQYSYSPKSVRGQVQYRSLSVRRPVHYDPRTIIRNRVPYRVVYSSAPVEYGTPSPKTTGGYTRVQQSYSPAEYAPKRVKVGGDRFINFYNLYTQYHSSYSKQFYDYCVQYAKFHPKGQYLPYAQQYLTSYKRYYYNGGVTVTDNFPQIYSRYYSSYSKYFYEYCRRYEVANPKSQYVQYARQYRSVYRKRFNVDQDESDFSLLYKKYKARFSLFFYKYCVKYIRKYPKGRHLLYAQQYVATYRKRLRGVHPPEQSVDDYSIAKIAGRYDSNLHTLYRKYGRRYSKYFYEYCLNYIKARPKGRFVGVARRYRRSYSKRYRNRGRAIGGRFNRNFYTLYTRYYNVYNKVLFKYCRNYIKIHPKGIFRAYARHYLSVYRKRYKHAARRIH